MAKKKNEDVKPEAGVEKGSENQVKTEEPKVQKSQKFSMATTDGRVIDNVKVAYDLKAKATTVSIDIGQLNPTKKNPRNGMNTVAARALTPEQAAEYSRLSDSDPKKGLEYAVKAAFPMHYDGAAFSKGDAEVNGRHVDYIVVENVTEKSVLLSALHKEGVKVFDMDAAGQQEAIDKMDPAKKESVLAANKGRIGNAEISFGEKGNTESRFLPRALNAQERAMRWERAEVTGSMKPVTDKEGKPVKDENGKQKMKFVIESVGKPITLADIAAHVENRVRDRQEKLEGAQKVDWSKFHLPEGASFTKNPKYNKVGDPDRVEIEAEVNHRVVKSMLSKNETTALRTGMATFEQAAMANKNFRTAVLEIAKENKAAVSEKPAIDAIVERVKSTQKAFTPEQKETLMAFAASKGSDDQRPAVFEELWGKASDQLSKDGVTNEKWLKDAHEELTDLGKGNERSEQQSMKR